MQRQDQVAQLRRCSNDDARTGILSERERPSSHVKWSIVPSVLGNVIV
jgi:hypothetical protein